VAIYAILTLFIIGFITFSYRHLESVNFDPAFAASVGIRCSLIENATFFLLVLAIVIGIRSVGVALMAGMLIAPASTARPLTHKLSTHFFLAGIIGIISGFCGNVLSVWIPKGRYTLPTGPMVLLSAAFFCILSLLLAPQNGLLIRLFRIYRFGRTCRMENALKALWKSHKAPLSWKMRWLLASKGWFKKGALTLEGRKKAEKIVRLHRLWEVYLVDYMGQGVEKVHRSAEELEHFITPQLERELTELLQDPKQDPHHQPIPPGGDI
jgi:manganese/zinc/iron transport system permease protein